MRSTTAPRFVWYQALAAIMLAAPSFASTLQAQSAQPVSIQASGALVFPSKSQAPFESDTRFGFDVQARYTFSRWSVGIGYQRSTVFRSSAIDVRAALSLFFVEPRLVVTANRNVGLYLAGRAGIGKLVCTPDRCSESSYATFGGGGGVLVRLSKAVAMDIGTQFFTVTDDANTGYFLARLGLGLGL